jgi:hypothetical protein
MLAHVGHNFAASPIPTPPDGGRQHFLVALLYLVMAMVVILWTEPRTLRPKAATDSWTNNVERGTDPTNDPR